MYTALSGMSHQVQGSLPAGEIEWMEICYFWLRPAINLLSSSIPIFGCGSSASLSAAGSLYWERWMPGAVPAASQALLSLGFFGSVRGHS